MSVVSGLAVRRGFGEAVPEATGGLGAVTALDGAGLGVALIWPGSFLFASKFASLRLRRIATTAIAAITSNTVAAAKTGLGHQLIQDEGRRPDSERIEA
jgi:hypothetical protein